MAVKIPRLIEGERGETDLLEMVIDTGDASPRKQAARHIPFAVRQEVEEQLKNMWRTRLYIHLLAPEPVRLCW